MEEASVGILPPFLSDAITFLGVVLSIILLIAFAYIWSTQRQDREDIAKLSAGFKQLSKKVKVLEENSGQTTVVKQEENLPNAEPFGMAIEKKVQPVESEPIENENISKNVWETFLENYNHIAESMAVPGQLKACENFVSENNLKILAYIGNMKFILVSSVADSRFWAWQIEGSKKYVVVPNPMVTYDEELHSREGMKETFASNYEKGKYTKYFVKLPAIFSYNNENDWKIIEPGVINLGH